MKWFLCDADLYPKVEQAVKTVPWPVEIITFGAVSGCTSTQDLMDDDGIGAELYSFKLYSLVPFKPFSIQMIIVFPACPQLLLDGESPAIILPTSGTSSSVAKGVVHSQKGVALTLAYSVYYSERIPDKPRLILGLPTHISAFILPFAFLTSPGGYEEVYLMRTLSIESMFKAIHQYKVRCFCSTIRAKWYPRIR